MLLFILGDVATVAMTTTSSSSSSSSGSSSSPALNLPHRLARDPGLAAAVAFLDRVQTPVNCTGARYAVAKAGHKAGLASQYQLTAIHWLKMLALHDYALPVLIAGRIVGYSEGPECGHTVPPNDWTCYFLPISGCQQELLTNGRQVDVKPERLDKLAIDVGHLIPPAFQARGMAWWWGVVQAYMFRPQALVEVYVQQQARAMGVEDALRGGFSFGGRTDGAPPVPVAGLHIRHGDKGSDGFKLYSLEAHVRAARLSQECDAPLQLLDGRCRLRAPAGMNTNNSNGSTHGSPLLRANEYATMGGGRDRGSPTKGNRFSSSVRHAENAQSGSGSGSSSSSMSSRSSGTSTSSGGDGRGEIMHVFVASDDKHVVAAARRKGYLSTRVGVSQETVEKGMAQALADKTAGGYNASLEILADMYFLAQCTTLVGTAASQVFRVAVGMSTALGLLRSAIIMDFDQLPKIRRWTEGFLPMPEPFVDGRT